MNDDTTIARRRLLALSATGFSALTLGSVLEASALNPPTPATLPAVLSERLPPSESSFADIVQAYLATAERKRFLLTLTQLQENVAVYDEFSRSVVTQRRTFEKLAETLLLFQDLLLQQGAAPQAEQARTIRRAYQHYIINTDGPIPLRPAADDFDVFAWATEYAAAFNVTLTPTTRADGQRETLMTLDDPQNPVRCKAWGSAEGRSSAWSLREAGHLINYRRYGRYDVIPSQLFAFEPRVGSHSKSNAMWLADIAQLVYLREGYVRAQFKRWGYEPVRWIENAATDTQAVVAVRNDHVVISFRGTEGRTDFLTDLLFPKLPFRIDSAGSRPLGKAHRGFVDALDSVWGQLLVALQGVGPDRPLFVSGHSLGAALAQLTAMRLESLGHAVAAVYVYGSPRVGDAQFRDAYNGVLKGRTFLHVNDRDIVTTVPPRWTGFAHVAQPARRFDEGHLITADDTESTSPASVPRGQDTQVANRDLMERAATVVRASHRYLGIDDLSAGAARSMTYGAQFDEGRLDDHGIAQYLFKFACAIVDDRIAAMT